MLSARALLLLSAATLALSGCAAEDEPVPTPTPTPTPTPSTWAPAGAPAAIILTNPGDGGTRTVRVGDRVRIPPSPDPGGIKIEDWGGVLVPYGDDRTYLAVAPRGRRGGQDRL